MAQVNAQQILYHRRLNFSASIVDRLNDIATFVQTVEAGSFSLAARRVGLTRSAVGKSIARLEKRLGARLFNRTTRRQTPTEAGRMFYERCKRGLEQIQAAEVALDARRREPIGRLRISVPVLFGRHCVAPILTELMRRHPRLDVEISFCDRVVDLVQEGFDLAVRIGPLSDSASLAARQLGVQRMIICAAPSYLTQHGSPVRIEDFAAHTGVTYLRLGTDIPWQMHDDAGHVRKVLLRKSIRMDDMQAIINAAASGVGLALVPSWRVVSQVAAGQLVVLTDQEHSSSADIYVVWPQTRYLASKTRVTIDALVAEVPTLVNLLEAG
jgi:DNA-binding transcriptional LysR family regulator